MVTWLMQGAIILDLGWILSKQVEGRKRKLECLNELIANEMPSSLSQATNLGKYDFFPAVSGKGNAVKYYLDKYGLKSDEAVALFDDENDLPMSEVVADCFVLQSTHESVTRAIKANPHWVVAKEVGVLAIENVLEKCLEKIRKEKLG